VSPVDGGNAAMKGFQATLAALSQEYEAGLAQRVGLAHGHLRACQAAPGDALPLLELHRGMHTMAGTAGTLGLAQVGERARGIEAELQRLLLIEGRSVQDFDAVALMLESLGLPLD